MKGLELTELREYFYLKAYYNLNERIMAIQNDYIKTRIKYIWKFPLLVNFATRKVILMFSEPEVKIMSIGKRGGYNIKYSQKVVLVGKSEFWAHLIMKREK